MARHPAASAAKQAAKQASKLLTMRWRCLCLLAVFLLAGMAGHAAPLQDDFTRQLWRVQDGLPEDTVQALAQDTHGLLWVATSGGIATFDGSEFTTLDLGGSAGMQATSIFCLLATADGSVWMGSEGGGLLRLHAGHLDRYGPAQGLTDLFVRALLEDEHGRIWVGTDTGIFRLPANGHMLQRLDDFGAVPAVAVHALAEDSDHTIWVGGSRLLSFNAQGASRVVPLPGLDSQNRVKSILPAGDGTLWVGTVGGLLRLDHDDGRFRKVAAITGTVRMLRETADHAVWIGTIGHGLWRMQSQQFARVDAAQLLPSKSVLALIEDKNKQLWVGTQGGLVRLSRTPVHILPLPHAADPDFETVARDHDGSIWVVASDVFHIRNDNATIEHFAKLGNPPVRNVYRATDGALWVGTDGQGAYRLQGDAVTHYRAPPDLPNNFVRAFLEARNGDMWLGTDEGLARIAHGSAPGHTQQYAVRDGLAHYSIRSLLETPDGDIWIGTEQGLSDWHAGRFVNNEITAALRGEKIWSLAESSGGFLWIGTRDHGLFRVHGSTLVQFTRAQGLATNSIYGIAEAKGRLWFSGPNTVFSSALTDLETSDGTPDHAVRVATYGLPFGASGAQFYGGRQPSVCVGQDGEVWFPSSKGAVYIRTAEEAAAPAKPAPVFIRTVAVDGLQLAPAAQKTKLAADARRLVISYAPLLLTPQHDVRFRYRLDGFDKAWIYAGAARTASYTALPAGTYHFHVQALDGATAGLEASFSVDKLRYFWQTPWFIAAALLLLGSATWSMYRLRIGRIHGRFEAVLLERGRLAREMHDTIIQGCTGISALLEALASRRKQAAGPEAELLDYARAQLKITIDEARDAVWNLRHIDQSNRRLSDLLEAIVVHARHEFALHIDYRWEGEALLVAEPIAHEVSMAVREAIYNAALHGRPRSISVAASLRGRQIHIHITDDGVGFVPHDEPGHYGITGMRERMTQLGGTFDLRSAPGEGAVVELVLTRAALQQHTGAAWQ